MKIRLLNPEAELKAFPLNQNIYLEASEEIETSYVEENIVLIRHIEDKQGALRTSDLYNSNIGHVKNIYSTVGLKITQEAQPNGTWKLTCNPVGPLAPASTYLLFVDKNLSSEFIDVVKTVTKGPSTISIKSVEHDAKVDTDIKLVVTSVPTITSEANIVKLQSYIDGQPYKTHIINTKSSKKILAISGIVLELEDTAYALGEEFEVTRQGSRKRLEQNFVATIKTSIDVDVKPLEGVEPSAAITYQDVLEYYQKLNSEYGESEQNGGTMPQVDLQFFSKSGWEAGEFSIEWVDEANMILHLNRLTTDMLDFDAMSIRQLPAYSRSDLKLVKLYDPDKKYKLTPLILDEKAVMLTVEAVEEDSP